jgi:hypothetical protein
MSNESWEVLVERNAGRNGTVYIKNINKKFYQEGQGKKKNKCQSGAQIF